MTKAARSYVGNAVAYDPEEIVFANPVLNIYSGAETLKGLREFMSVPEAIAIRRCKIMHNPRDQDLDTGLRGLNVYGFNLESNIAVDEVYHASAMRFAEHVLPTLGKGWPFAVSRVNVKLAELTKLLHGWDSYEGKPTERTVADKASEWFSAVFEPELPAPQVVPCGDGGVQLEWHIGGLHVEVYFHTDSSIEYWFENDVTGQTGEGELPDGNAEIKSALSSLRGSDVIGRR